MKNTKSLRLALLAIACALSLAVAFAFAGNKTAEADDYVSYGAKYFSSKNATVESFKNKASNSFSSSTGFRTEITPEYGETDVTVMLNQTVVPRTSTAADLAGASNKGEMFTFDKYVVNGENQAVADMVVITYTSLNDVTKQLSVVNKLHSGAWNGVLLSFTDDVEYRNGNVYVAGTEQTVVGGTSYNAVGTIISGSQKATGPIFGAPYYYLCITGDGNVCHNQWQNYGNILSETFLENSRANLDPSNPYYERYTQEWAQSVFAALSDKCIMTVRYYNVHAPVLGFNMRQLNGQWLGDAGAVEPSTTYPFSLPAKDKLYTGETYTVEELLERHSTYLEDGAVVAEIEGWTDKDNENTATWFSNATASTKTVQKTEVGEMIFHVLTRCNSEPKSWSNRYVWQYITLKFEDGSPKVSAKENNTLVNGITYDLKSLFDIWHLGEEEQTNYAFKIDGEDITGNEFTADTEGHTVEINITDKNGVSASASATTSAVEISVPSSVDLDCYYGKPVYFPVPTMPSNTDYSLTVTDAVGNFVTKNNAYIFDAAGDYKITYKFAISGSSTPLSLECAARVTLAHETPVITVNGEYKTEYVAGQTLTVLGATATDGRTDYAVSAEIYKGNEKLSGESVKLSAGNYRIVYSCEYGDGQTVTETREITVAADEEKPNIVIDGKYSESYRQGNTISVLVATATDNSGETPEYSVKVYLGEEELIPENGEVKLERAGNYRIVYSATDGQGNKTENICEFTVEPSGSKNAAKPNVTVIIIVSAAVLAAIIAAAAVVIIRRAKKRK